MKKIFLKVVLFAMIGAFKGVVRVSIRFCPVALNEMIDTLDQFVNSDNEDKRFIGKYLKRVCLGIKAEHYLKEEIRKI